MVDSLKVSLSSLRSLVPNAREIKLLLHCVFRLREASSAWFF